MSITVSGGKFNLGTLVMTRGVSDKCAQDEKFSAFVISSLGKHGLGDWGNLSDDDKKENEYSLDKYLRLLSSYEIEDLPNIWIITEADRSATTILFPDEY